MERITLCYDHEEPIRLDKFLASELDDFSRSRIQDLIEKGMIRVQEKMVKASHLLKKGDWIEIEIDEPVPSDIVAEDIPLEIVYEDGDLLVVNKPSGMVVHPAVGHFHGTLVHALMHHCKDLSGINGIARAGIVHRIDKDTSGLLVVCKNDHAHKNISRQLAEKTAMRKYVAIVHGVIPHNHGKIDAPLGRNPNNRQQFSVVESGKNAITHFNVLERFENQTLVELMLETGRTHQIRVHMQYIGYPVVGDPVYGPKKKIGDRGQFLHAKTLGFVHPTHKTYMEFSSELPDFFMDYLKKIRD